MVKNHVDHKSNDAGSFFEITTIHGLCDWFFARDRPSRFFWLTVILLCCGVLSYSCVQMALDFRNSPPVTTINVDRIDFFPSLLYCPGGIVALKKTMEELNIDARDIVFMNDFFSETNTLLYNTSNGYKVINSSDSWNTLHEKLDILGLTLVGLLDKLTDIEFDSMTFTKSGLAPQSRVKPTRIINVFGICYKFNFSNVAWARQGHFTTYLEIEFDAFSKQMPPEIAVYYEHGMLYFGDESNSFNPIMPAYTHDGKKNYVVMKQSAMRLKNLPRAPCNEADYSKVSEPVFDCYSNVTFTHRRCNMMRNLNETDETHCHLFHHILYNLTLSESCLGSMDLAADLDDRMPCTYELFETTVNAVTQSNSGRTTIHLQYQQAISLIFAQHEPYTLEVFLSNMGGLISLLCGASLISVIQVVYFATATTVRRVHRTTNNTESRVTNRPVWQRNSSLDETSLRWNTYGTHTHSSPVI